ncbi:MAG: two pore domain potassium channel family protein, partial [Candidatus Angelobacter sp.]
SPPSALELLRRHAGPHGLETLTEVFEHWEQWSAELMESHLSYPVLAYFRSQHDNQSWIASLTAILDCCTLAMVGLEGLCQYQARMTFAIARHALVDLSQVFSAAPENNSSVNRLPPSDLLQIRQQLRDVGFVLNHDDGGDSELQRLRGLYEPYAVALAQYLALDLPPWIKDDRPKDNWQTSAWQQQYSQQPRPVSVQDDHY